MEQKEKKDKSGLLAKSIIGIISTAMLALFGFWGNMYLNARQERELKSRLYIELISGREKAESDLRKDMFTSIISSFLKDKKDSITLESKLLNLELLSYNFHESLNLKPLFRHLENQILWEEDEYKRNPKSNKSVRSPSVFKGYMKRLTKVAKEVKRKQIAVLESAGDIINLKVPIKKEGKEENTFCLELNSFKRKFRVSVLFDSTRINNEIRLEVWESSDLCTIDYSEVHTQEIGRAEDDWDEESGEPSSQDVADILQKENEMELGKGSSELRMDVYAEFGMDVFDFPMIDNTRLPDDQRCAVVLNEYNSDTTELDITVLFFPGSHASLKEKPYYEDILKKLRS